MARILIRAFAFAFVFMATMGAVIAADMPRKAAALDAYASTGPTFAGFYIGPSIGYAWAETKAEFEGDFRIKPDGFVGGGQAGVNWQYGQVVAGFEADLHYMNIKDKLSGAICEGDCGVSGKYDLLASFRARLGLTIINPNTLLYVTGGAGWGRSSLEGDGLTLGTNHFGWTAGGGLEVILSQHWTARVQYIHYNFGNTTVAGVLPTKDVVNLATVGLNFRF